MYVPPVTLISLSENKAAELVTLNVPPLLFVNVNSDVAASALPLITNVSALTELIKELKSTSKLVSEELPTKFISFVPLLYVPPLTKLSVTPVTSKVPPLLLVNVIISVPLTYVPPVTNVSVVVIPLKLEPSP